MLNLFIGRAKIISQGEQSLSFLFHKKLHEDQRPHLHQNETINQKWTSRTPPLPRGQDQRNLHRMTTMIYIMTI